VLWASLAWAGTVGTISGKVTDAATGQPLPGVNVYLPQLQIGAITDEEGEFIIDNVPVGLHIIEFRMVGYATVRMKNVRVIMDQTTPLSVRMRTQVIQGQEVEVTAQRPLVEKDVTLKKTIRSEEEIRNLPTRDLSEMLTLESGFVQIKSSKYGIPGFEDRGIEQIHVRGGRSGEIGYTIDGMYIENPIYGGIGKGTRLNKYAVKELEVQTGVFSAEYGDAMSSIVNNITMTGGSKYEGRFTIERSNLGALSAPQDQLRDYQKYIGALGGPLIPGSDKITFYVSADYTTQAYRVLKFDDKVYLPNDPGNRVNRANKVNWLDRYSGWRKFGFDRTFDIFSKLHWRIDNHRQLNLSYWYVDSHFMTYSRVYQFYEEGKNVNRKWSERWALEFRDQINPKLYYTIRLSRFTQQMKIGVRNGDMDGDGYPDWVEYKIGTEARGVHNGVDYHGECDIPYENGERYGPGAEVENNTDKPIELESWGPGCLRTQVVYYERKPEYVGTSQFDTSYVISIPHGGAIIIEPYDKIRIRDKFLEEVVDEAGNVISSKSYSNGYLINPLDSLEYYDKRGNRHMWHYGDPLTEYLAQGQYTEWSPMLFPDSTYNLYSSPPPTMTAEEIQAMRDSLYYIFFYEYFSAGADRYRHWTKSVTDEVKFDITWRASKHHQLRTGVDFKRHLITFDETQLPWLARPYGETYGLPGTVERKNGWEAFLYGTGEKMPLEIGAYIKDKLEYPWMTVNIGLRVDLQNPEDSTWADPRNPASGLVPSKWKVLWSPRIGISHVITDKATFTFGYGKFYQNPTYRNVYLNNARDLTTPLPIVGNANMQAQKVSSYEFGLNLQFADYWRLGLVGWSKDYSDLAATERVKAFPYSYSVMVNYDYGSARGIDFSLEKRGGGPWTALLQYTLSRATANRADPWQGYRSSDTPETMPKKEVLMNYDRTHNLTITGGVHLNRKNTPGIGGFYPLANSTVYLTFVAMSGAPYTPFDINLNRPGATNSERMPWYIETNLAARKNFKWSGVRWTAGLIVRNLFNRKNVIDIYEETGSPTDPGRIRTQAIEEGSSSSTLYDRPYYFSNPRQIDLTLEASF